MLSRRDVVQGAAISAVFPLACRRRATRRTASAQALVEAAYAGIVPQQMLDAHVHIVGLGTGGTGCRVNPKLMDPVRHPVEWARFQIYQQASGVRD